MQSLKRFLVSFVLLSLAAACDYTDFESIWQDPNARPMDLRTERVAAFLLSANESVRRSFEYNLASQLKHHGIQAAPGYDLLAESDVTDKSTILADLRNTGFDHAVFMKVIDRKMEVNYTPGSNWYPGSYYDPFFWYSGSFIGPWGPGGPWPPYGDAGYYTVDEVVSVETLVYSVPDSKLIWSGLSKTMNPDHIDDFVKELVSGAAHEMKKTGLLPGKA